MNVIIRKRGYYHYAICNGLPFPEPYFKLLQNASKFPKTFDTATVLPCKQDKAFPLAVWEKLLSICIDTCITKMGCHLSSALSSPSAALKRVRYPLPHGWTERTLEKIVHPSCLPPENCSTMTSLSATAPPCHVVTFRVRSFVWSVSPTLCSSISPSRFVRSSLLSSVGMVFTPSGGAKNGQSVRTRIALWGDWPHWQSLFGERPYLYFVWLNMPNPILIRVLHIKWLNREHLIGSKIAKWLIIFISTSYPLSDNSLWLNELKWDKQSSFSENQVGEKAYYIMRVRWHLHFLSCLSCQSPAY